MKKNMNVNRSYLVLIAISLTIVVTVALLLCFYQLQQSFRRNVALQRNVDELRTECQTATIKIEKLLKDSATLHAKVIELEKQCSLPDDTVRERKIADFFAARGLELMKMGRFKDAAASFEIAIRAQPRNVLFLETVIDCYTESKNEFQINANRKKQSKLLEEYKTGYWILNAKQS